MGTIDALLGFGKPKNRISTYDALVGNDPSWYRQDGTKKGMGFLGPLRSSDNQIMSELSVGVNIDGKEMDIPSFVPTLSPQEVSHLIGGGEMNDAIVMKAAEHARMRLKQGKPVWATPGIDY